MMPIMTSPPMLDADNVANVSVVPIFWKAECGMGGSTEFRVRGLCSCPTPVMPWLAVWPQVSHLASLSQFPCLYQVREMSALLISVLL